MKGATVFFLILQAVDSHVVGLHSARNQGACVPDKFIIVEVGGEFLLHRAKAHKLAAQCIFLLLEAIAPTNQAESGGELSGVLNQSGIHHAAMYHSGPMGASFLFLKSEILFYPIQSTARLPLFDKGFIATPCPINFLSFSFFDKPFTCK